MAYSRHEDPERIRAAGDRVEVIDANHKYCGQFGIVAFFVHDNIYVRFPGRFPARFWSSTKMFFPEQLRRSLAPPVHERLRHIRVLNKLRTSLQKIRP